MKIAANILLIIIITFTAIFLMPIVLVAAIIFYINHERH